MGTLGHRIFEPINAPSSLVNVVDHAVDREPVLHLQTNKAKATGKRTVCGKINVHTIAAQKYTTPQAA